MKKDTDYNKSSAGYDPENSSQFLHLYMRDEDIEAHLTKVMQQSESELRSKIPNFDRNQYSRRKAMLDMQFNMGDDKFRPYKKDGTKAWPNLFNAILNNDWKTAAKESRRKGVSDARNHETYRLYEESGR